MPAINIRDLENKVNKLINTIDNPFRFYNALKDLYEYYTDRTFRPNREKSDTRIIPNYRLLPQVQRSIRKLLIPHLISSPAHAFRLAKVLWNKSYFEYKELAILIIAAIPFQNQQNKFEILADWSLTTNEGNLQKSLSSDGISSLVEQYPVDLLKWIENIFRVPQSRKTIFSYYCLHQLIKSNPKKLLPDIILLMKETLSPPINDNQFHYYEIFSQMKFYLPEETNFLVKELLIKYPENKIIKKLEKL